MMKGNKIMKDRLFSPPLRLIYVILLGIGVSAIRNVNLLQNLTACLAVGYLVWLLWQRQSLGLGLKKWAKFNLFSLLVWLTLSWQVHSQGISLNPAGIELAWQISLRMNVIMLGSWLLLWKMDDLLLVQAISQLPLPSKLIQLIVLTVRYIALIGERHQKISLAMRARGYQPRADFRTLKITAQQITLLLIHAMLKAETAEMALKSRGFDFGQSRKK